MKAVCLNIAASVERRGAVSKRSGALGDLQEARTLMSQRRVRDRQSYGGSYHSVHVSDDELKGTSIDWSPIFERG